MPIYWITGLPGSGKTTAAKELLAYLKSRDKTAVILDGDLLREAFSNRFGYSRNDRIFLGKTYLNLAMAIESQNLDVIVSTVSLFAEVHSFIAENRKQVSIKIVFINAENELLDSRNQKNLRSGKITQSPGIDLKIEFPVSYDLLLNGEEQSEALEAKFRELISE